MSTRNVFAGIALAAVLAVGAGCASSGPSRLAQVQPGDVFVFEGDEYRLQQVQEDFIILKYRDPEVTEGPISGFVDEVFRVSRYDLGSGRWYAHERFPGVYLQWLGLDSFALVRVPDAPKGVQVTMLK